MMNIKKLAQILTVKNLKIATAESCTGGLVAASLTDISGSSVFFERGFVTYSNAAKSESLDVPASLIEAHGAVSEEVACAMAAGALLKSQADIAVSTTGVAGPDGGTPEKPVGTVWFALAQKNRETESRCFHFEGDRAAVRNAAVDYILSLLLTRVSD